MHQQHAQHDAIARLYASVADDEAEDASLRIIRDAIGGEHAVLARREGGGGQTWCSERDPLTRSTVTRLADASFDICQRHLPTGRATRMMAHLGHTVLARDKTYQRWLRPIGGGLAMTCQWQQDGAGYMLAVCRDLDRHRDFSDVELQSAGFLLPHLQQVLRLRERLRAQQHEIQRLHAALDTLADGLLLVDADLRLRHHNAAAEAWLGSDAGLKLRHGCVRLVDARLQARLEALVQAAQDPASALAASAARLLLPRSASRQPLQLSVLPLEAARQWGASSHIGLPVTRDGVVLQLHAPIMQAVVEDMALMQGYGLTRREAELATWLRAGRCLADAAQTMRITAGTARQYLKQVFAKTGARRQSELVSMLGACLPPDVGDGAGPTSPDGMRA